MDLVLQVAAVATVLGTARAHMLKDQDPNFDVSRTVAFWALEAFLYAVLTQVLWVTTQ